MRRWSGDVAGGVGVVDEQRLDRRIRVFDERAAELVHVDEARRRLVGARSTCASMPHDAELLIV